jgi:hypothetical protein
VPDAQQINARSRLTSEAALRDNRLSRLPSSGSNSRTNTDGGRIHTSKIRDASRFDNDRPFPVDRYETEH